MTYDYLKKYMWYNFKGQVLPFAHNIFYEVQPTQIKEAEERLGFSFPSQLKEFYQEIGYGVLNTPHPSIKSSCVPFNNILPPKIIANFMEGILLNDKEQLFMSEDFYEDLEPGDMPFFEIGESSSFLLMKPLSENPNAVWTRSEIKIEDSFEKLIYKLYYESPCFYDDVIESYYEEQKNS